MSTLPISQSASESDEAVWLEIVRHHVGPLDFGAVLIVVHDQKVVEIDTTTRVRIAQAVSPARAGAKNLAAKQAVGGGQKPNPVAVLK